MRERRQERRKEGEKQTEKQTEPPPLASWTPSLGVFVIDGVSPRLLLSGELQEHGSRVLFTHPRISSAWHGACHRTGTQPVLADSLNEL